MDGTDFSRETLTEDELKTADANGDNTVTISDVTEIQRYLAELPANVRIGHIISTKIKTISFAEQTMTITLGESVSPAVVIFPAYAENTVLQWSSTNNSVAAVDQKGVITALSKGTATIYAKATDGTGVQGFCTVKVEGIKVSSIKLSETSMTISAGESQTLTAEVLPTDAENMAIEWSSSNTAVASVDQNGKVTAVSKGTATIYAKAKDGSGVQGYCAVNVEGAKVSSITLSSTSLGLKVGDSQTLTANVLPANAENKSVEWSSSDSSVASVAQNGKVTAVGKGTATIYAKAKDGTGVQAKCTVTVEAVKVSSIKLSSDTLGLTVGESQTLTATVSPSNAENKSVEWSSSDTAVATVDQNGKVKAVAKGTATVYAKAKDGSGAQASCAVTVTGIKVSSIKLSSTSISLNKGQTKTLTATVSPSNADNKTIEWSSSNTAAATVDQNGKVTATGAGTATIYAKAKDGTGVQASSTVTVTVIKVSSIRLSQTSLSLTKGQSQTLTAAVSPSNASDSSLQWSSSNTSAATVDQNGKVTAVGAGTATIYAKAKDGSGVQASCTVTVSGIKVTSITLSKTTLSLTKGQSQTLTATISPSNSDNKSVEWSSSKTSVATVDQYGKITAAGEGTATIYAKAKDGSGVQASCTVTVTVIKVSSIKLSSTSLSLTTGQSQTLTATVSPTNASDKSVAWSSSNTAAATVDQNGKVTAASAGTATIYAKAKDGSGVQASCTVTVTKPVERVYPTSIKLNKQVLNLSEGGSAYLTATLSPSNVTEKNITWYSEDPDIASVDSKTGLVTANWQGSVYITAETANRLTAECLVTVSFMSDDDAMKMMYQQVISDINKNAYLYDSDGNPFIMGHTTDSKNNELLYSITRKSDKVLNFFFAYDASSYRIVSNFDTDFTNTFNIKPEFMMTNKTTSKSELYMANVDARTIKYDGTGQDTSVRYYNPLTGATASSDYLKACNSALQMSLYYWDRLLLLEDSHHLSDIGFESYSAP
ncbi:Ig-like domain-containing protein [Lachnoclostridium sp. MSJ-17]|uniref:Ig-like domain-containing protein n=1 Tax=Lachnoclostridium sp. MSJ-17 TaxID=2841516 RepID=UPI001C0FC824|nr:Ig-like domain-containing protein [Lachnoclostridium sp. MSJ-17]MBU5462022.1 Ig-like domain-containing protein [Lachnoclostridium sp. MSJ-17]